MLSKSCSHASSWELRDDNLPNKSSFVERKATMISRQRLDHPAHLSPDPNNRRLGLSTGQMHPRKHLHAGQTTVLPRS
jgi:hypothetical protein